MALYARSITPAVSLSLACALWGIATVISKAILASIPPITFLVIQLVPSVFVLWVLVATRGGYAQTWRGLLPLALLGLLNPGLAYTLSMLGLAQTTASVATLLWAAEPALIVVTAWLLLEEPITVRFLAATAAAACGVILVSGVVGGGHVLTAGGYGSALILGGVFCCALYTVLMRQIAPTIDPLPAVAIQQTAGLAWVVAIWPLEPGGDAIGSLAALSNQELLGGSVGPDVLRRRVLFLPECASVRACDHGKHLLESHARVWRGDRLCLPRRAADSKPMARSRNYPTLGARIVDLGCGAQGPRVLGGAWRVLRSAATAQGSSRLPPEVDIPMAIN